LIESLTAGERRIDLSSPVCMGIINATPDSFSDGAELQKPDANSFQLDIDKALSRAEAMVADGATFIDVGGESTRPGAAAVTEQEELDRVIPVIEAIRDRLDVCISADTSSPTVMEEAINSGAELINDVRALSTPGAIEAVSASKAAVCLMHMQGKPDSMQTAPTYDHVTDEVVEYLVKNGTMEPKVMFDTPFTLINDQGIAGVFDEDASKKVIELVRHVNENADITKSARR